MPVVIETADYTFDVMDALTVGVPVCEAVAPPAEGRSPHWRKLAHDTVEAHPFCVVCNTKGGLQVHHIRPFHLHPELELTPSNLVVLCQPHHFLFGHLCDWKKWNPSVMADVVIWAGKVARR